MNKIFTYTLLLVILLVTATISHTEKVTIDAEGHQKRHPGVDKSNPMTSIHSVYDVLKSHLPSDEFEQVRRILYGKNVEHVSIPSHVLEQAEKLNFEIKHYSMVNNTLLENRRSRRVVRIGVIQNQIVVPTDRPVEEQFMTIRDRIGEIAEIAGQMGVNILALQEAWTMPFAYVYCHLDFFPACY